MAGKTGLFLREGQAMAGDGLPASEGGGKRKSWRVPEEAEEIWLDLRRERLIRVLGCDKSGKLVKRHLKITDKGRMALL